MKYVYTILGPINTHKFPLTLAHTFVRSSEIPVSAIFCKLIPCWEEFGKKLSDMIFIFWVLGLPARMYVIAKKIWFFNKKSNQHNSVP